MNFWKRIPLLHRHVFVLSFFSFLLVFISGCSTYQNITGYFNTYYNAAKLFDDAANEVARTPQKDRDTNYFAAVPISKATEDKFNKVIEKCSKLIQFYPQSKLIDDGVLMIGKSYVYKLESESALRKFAEIFENFPTSDLRFDAKLWSAKAQYQAKKDDEALKIIKELFPEARAEGKNDILLETLMLEAQIFFDRAEYDQAAATLALAVQVSGDNDLRARAQFQMGVCFERLGDNVKAAEAYGAVKEFGPDFAMEFRARLKQGMTLCAGGEYDKALLRFDELKDEQLRNDELGLVELGIANTFKLMGDTARAFAIYDDIDTTYKRTEASARSFYQRGNMYEKEYADFRAAQSYYDRAKSEFPTADITPLAQQRAASLASYFTLHTNLHKYDSLLYITLHPESIKVKPDSLRAKADSLMHNQDSLNSNSIATIARDSSFRNDSTVAQIPPHGLLDDSLKMKMKLPDIPNDQMMPPGERIARELGDAGNHAGPARDSLNAFRKFPDSARVFSEKRHGKGDTASARNDSLKLSSKKPAQPAVARLSPDSLRSLLAKTTFELAGLFFLELDRSDSALVWYDMLVQQYPASPLMPRALYAMAELHRVRHDSAAVDSLYGVILDKYARSDYAVQIRKVLGKDTSNAEMDPAVSRYEGASALLQSGNVQKALDGFRLIAQDYPASPFAPKSLYAVGWIYESILIQKDSAFNDSAAVWYKKLMKSYPVSVYAVAVQPRVAVKDDPKTLAQYVRIKEIPLLGKQESPGKRRQGLQNDREKNAAQQEEDLQRNRRENRDEQDDEQVDEEEPPDPDDDN